MKGSKERQGEEVSRGKEARKNRMGEGKEIQKGKKIVGKNGFSLVTNDLKGGKRKQRKTRGRSKERKGSKERIGEGRKGNTEGKKIVGRINGFISSSDL